MQVKADVLERIAACGEGLQRIIEQRTVVGLEKDPAARRKDRLIAFQKKGAGQPPFCVALFRG